MWLRSTWRTFDWVLNERSVNDGGNLYPLWLMILKSIWHRIVDNFRAATLLAVSCNELYFAPVAPWNGLEHPRRKARLRVYFNWFLIWCLTLLKDHRRESKCDNNIGYYINDDGSAHIFLNMKRNNLASVSLFCIVFLLSKLHNDLYSITT